MVLGLDMATVNTGWSILNYDMSLVDYGVFHTLSKDPLDRIKEIYLFLEELLTKYQIDVIVAENVPITNKNNLKIGSDLLRLQGATIALSIRYNKPIILYNPSGWRSLVGTYNGTREGTKREFQKQRAVDIVNSIYNLSLEYYSYDTKTKQTDDDKAEAILIARAFLTERSE